MPFFPANIENRSVQAVGSDREYVSPLRVDSFLEYNAPSTFFFRVEGADSDLIVVDRSRGCEDGSLVIVYENGEFVVRRLHIEDDGKMLVVDENGNNRVISDDVVVWGRVVYYIKSV